MIFLTPLLYSLLFSLPNNTIIFLSTFLSWSYYVCCQLLGRGHLYALNIQIGALKRKTNGPLPPRVPACTSPPNISLFLRSLSSHVLYHHHTTYTGCYNSIAFTTSSQDSFMLGYVFSVILFSSVRRTGHQRQTC